MEGGGKLMYTYKIASFGYEDWSRDVLQHEREFSQEEFDSMILECLLDGYHKWMERPHGTLFRNDDTWINLIARNLSEDMCKKFGFADFEEVYTREFTYFSNTEIRPSDHVRSEDSDWDTPKIKQFMLDKLGPYIKPEEAE
jgi:hypothetical protein